jgi:hypothetical protein
MQELPKVVYANLFLFLDDITAMRLVEASVNARKAMTRRQAVLFDVIVARRRAQLLNLAQIQNDNKGRCNICAAPVRWNFLSRHKRKCYYNNRHLLDYISCTHFDKCDNCFIVSPMLQSKKSCPLSEGYCHTCHQLIRRGLMIFHRKKCSCQQRTAAGHQCRNRSINFNGLCGLHTASPKMCQGTTKNGLPCKRKPLKNKTYCPVHIVKDSKNIKQQR